MVTPEGVRAFTVRGLLEPQGLARTLDGRLVVMDMYAAEDVFTSAGQINRIDGRASIGRKTRSPRRSAAGFPTGLTVEQPRFAERTKRRSGLQMMLSAFGLLVVMVGFVICYSRLGVLFEARTWEVGLVRAVGLSRSAVFLELLKESVVLGLLGAGPASRSGSSSGVTACPSSRPRRPCNTICRYPSPIWRPGARRRLGVASGIGSAVLAAAVPAVRLARRQPVAALTMRGRELDRLPSNALDASRPLIAAIVGW